MIAEMNEIATYEKALLMFWKPVKSFYLQLEDDINSGKFKQ